MTPKMLSVLLLCATIWSWNPVKSYTRQYHQSGQLQAEGWLENAQKTGFWKYYHDNGQLAEAGHFLNDLKTGYWHFYDRDGNLIKEGHYQKGSAHNWWIFYDLVRQEHRKVQILNNQKNGYCLVYKEHRLQRVEKFIADKKTGSWTSLRHFRRDNPKIAF